MKSQDKIHVGVILNKHIVHFILAIKIRHMCDLPFTQSNEVEDGWSNLAFLVYFASCFRLRRGTVDAILIVRETTEKAEEHRVLPL